MKTEKFEEVCERQMSKCSEDFISDMVDQALNAVCNTPEFIKLTEKIKLSNIYNDQLNRCRFTLIEKAKEYVLDNKDRLKAFKLNWLNRSNINKKSVLWGQMVKHLSSIYDMCQINDLNYDARNLNLWEEKITDTINYLLILRAIVQENVEESFNDIKVGE